MDNGTYRGTYKTNPLSEVESREGMFVFVVHDATATSLPNYSSLDVIKLSNGTVEDSIHNTNSDGTLGGTPSALYFHHQGEWHLVMTFTSSTTNDNNYDSEGRHDNVPASIEWMKQRLEELETVVGNEYNSGVRHGYVYLIRRVERDHFAQGVTTVESYDWEAGPDSVISPFQYVAFMTTDANGIAKIKITDVPKKYTMTTTYDGKSVKNTVIVKQVLKAKKVTVKKTAKKFTLKATLKINGKLVKGKVITFKFNGKTYKVKTNKKGIAQKTLDKKVIKKLKKGKTYTVKVTYLKDTIKTTVKVK